MQIENKPVLTQANKPPGGDNPRTGALHFMKTLLELLWSISFARKGNCMKKEFIKHHDDGSLWAKGVASILISQYRTRQNVLKIAI